MNPNTRIRLEDLTEDHCKQIIGAYKSLGLKVNDLAMNPTAMVSSIQNELRRGDDLEYRPDGISQNKLDFELGYADDDCQYLHVKARALSSDNATRIAEEFDKKMRELFADS